MSSQHAGWPTVLGLLMLTACGSPSAGTRTAESPVVAAPAPEPAAADAPAPAASADPEPTRDAGSSTNSEAARITVAKMIGEAIHSAALKWRTSNPDQCPTLESLIGEGLLVAGQDEDAWDRRYALSCDDDGVTVTSFGPDGQPGTPDDVVTGP